MFVDVIFACGLQYESALTLPWCRWDRGGWLVGRWDGVLWGRRFLVARVVVGFVSGRVASCGWLGVVVVHVYVVEDVGVLSVGAMIVLWCGFCHHVAVDGVDRGVKGSLSPPLVLLIVRVEDGGCRFGVSGSL